MTDIEIKTTPLKIGDTFYTVETCQEAEGYDKAVFVVNWEIEAIKVTGQAVYLYSGERYFSLKDVFIDKDQAASEAIRLADNLKRKSVLLSLTPSEVKVFANRVCDDEGYQYYCPVCKRKFTNFCFGESTTIRTAACDCGVNLIIL